MCKDIYIYKIYITLNYRYQTWFRSAKLVVSPRLVENPVGSPAESPSPRPRALPVVDTALTGLSMASSVALARPSKSTGKIRWFLQWEFQDLIKCGYCMVPYHIRLYFLGIFLKWPLISGFMTWHYRDGHRSGSSDNSDRQRPKKPCGTATNANQRIGCLYVSIWFKIRPLQLILLAQDLRTYVYTCVYICIIMHNPNANT